jgi:hypothetical protein
VLLYFGDLWDELQTLLGFVIKVSSWREMEGDFRRRELNFVRV